MNSVWGVKTSITRDISHWIFGRSFMVYFKNLFLLECIARWKKMVELKDKAEASHALSYPEMVFLSVHIQAKILVNRPENNQVSPRGWQEL